MLHRNKNSSKNGVNPLKRQPKVLNLPSPLRQGIDKVEELKTSVLRTDQWKNRVRESY